MADFSSETMVTHTISLAAWRLIVGRIHATITTSILHILFPRLRGRMQPFGRSRESWTCSILGYPEGFFLIRGPFLQRSHVIDMYSKISLILRALTLSVLGALLLFPRVAIADVELPCNVSFAEELSDEEDEFELDLGRIDDFCECKVVTPGFSRYIQARSNFADVLSRSADLCPDVASAISNPAIVTTAAAPVAALAGSTGSGDTAVPSEPAGAFARLASLGTIPPVPNGRSRCTVNSAMSVIQSGDFGGLCECDVVTLGFVRYLQTRSDIGDILDQTAGQCADLAVVLSETPVAAIFNNRYVASDPRGAARGTCTESECGGEAATTSAATTSAATTSITPPPPPPPPERYHQGHPSNPDGSTPYGPES